MVATEEGAHNAAAPPPGSQAPSTLGEAMERVADALQRSGAFFGHGTDNPWDEAVQLVLAAASLPADSDAGCTADPITAVQWQQAMAWLQARMRSATPLPYLTGRAWFAGHEFICDARALVPRSPLAELILDGYAPWWSGTPPRHILDLCCGGGCIGLAAALEAPEATVLLSDLDPDALSLARENLALHALGERVSIHRSDLFRDLPAWPRNFDIILCNPPYVDAADSATMPREFRAEPPQALAAGHDGLDLALQILADAPAFLSDEGVLFLELGNSWEALDALCPRLALTWLDFAGGGHGVLMATRRDLSAWQAHFAVLAARRRGAGV
jgi:ribosomal protein L3 glutamine methyltransferase